MIEDLRTFDDCLDLLYKACGHLRGPNALAWSVIDTKSETTVTLALALAVNDLVGKRIAHVEYSRTDLVFADRAIVDGGHPIALFEAKAIYLTDYEAKRIQRARMGKDRYLGEDIDNDLTKLAETSRTYPNTLGHAALFYLYELTDSSRMLKYGGRAVPDLQYAFDAMDELVTSGSRIHVPCVPGDFT